MNALSGVQGRESQGPQCRRCKADLSLLFALEEQRRQTLRKRGAVCGRGEWRAAMEHAETADWLRGDEEAQQFLAVAKLFNRDFSGAWRCYQNWRVAKGAGNVMKRILIERVTTVE